MTIAFDPATAAFVREHAPKRGPKPKPKRPAPFRFPPHDKAEAVKAFIASRSHNAILRHPGVLALDLDRENLWPDCDARSLARFMKTERTP